jgi:hypothetical protein
MDTQHLSFTLPPTAELGSAFQSPHTAPQPMSAPPELVGKFEALMSRVAGPDGVDAAGSTVPTAAVSHVENHLKHHAAVMERVLAVSQGDLSLADMQVFQAQAMVQMGLLSMTQAAYVQVLGSSKSSVSALMKNQ